MDLGDKLLTVGIEDDQDELPEDDNSGHKTSYSLFASSPFGRAPFELLGINLRFFEGDSKFASEILEIPLA